MSKINFIPQKYVRAQALRCEIARSGVLLLTLALVMGGWRTVQGKHREMLERRTAELDSQIDLVNQRKRERSARRTVSLLSADERSLLSKLTASVPSASVLALVAELMPASLGLTSLSLEAEPVEPIAKKEERNRKRDSDRPGIASMKLVLEGLAPADVIVAKFIGNLDERDVFENVELSYSRPVEDGELEAREFQITAEIPLDRTYVRNERPKEPHAD